MQSIEGFPLPGSHLRSGVKSFLDTKSAQCKTHTSISMWKYANYEVIKIFNLLLEVLGAQFESKNLISPWIRNSIFQIRYNDTTIQILYNFEFWTSSYGAQLESKGQNVMKIEIKVGNPFPNPTRSIFGWIKFMSGSHWYFA